MEPPTLFPRNRTRAALGLSTVMIVAGFIATPSAARADQVDDLIEQGVALRMQGKLAQALDLFTRANALAPSARTLAQMGLAEGALHRWTVAEGHLAAALESHDTPWIDVPRNREALERALATVRSHIGIVNFVGPPGAIVSVDGREIGHLPLASPLRLAEGAAHVAANARGYAPAEIAVAIAGGTSQTVVLPLAPLPSPASAAVPARLHLLDQPPPEGRWKTWTGLSLLGVSVAALATGIVWVVLDGHSSCGAASSQPCLWVYDTKLQGWLAIGAGVAAGAAGGFLLWSAPRASAAVAAGPGSLALVGRF